MRLDNNKCQRSLANFLFSQYFQVLPGFQSIYGFGQRGNYPVSGFETRLTRGLHFYYALKRTVTKGFRALPLLGIALNKKNVNQQVDSLTNYDRAFKSEKIQPVITRLSYKFSFYNSIKHVILSYRKVFYNSWLGTGNIKTGLISSITPRN